MRNVAWFDRPIYPYILGCMRFVSRNKVVNVSPQAHLYCLSVYIQDKNYFGKGTSYGKFQDETYFLCKKGSGLFVSLEKLFPYHPQDTSAAQPSSHHSMPTVEGVGQQGHTQPHSNSRHHQDNVIEVTNVSAAPATLEVGSSIELVGNPSLHGVIMWMGTLPGVRGTPMNHWCGTSVVPEDVVRWNTLGPVSTAPSSTSVL